MFMHVIPYKYLSELRRVIVIVLKTVRQWPLGKGASFCSFVFHSTF